MHRPMPRFRSEESLYTVHMRYSKKCFTKIYRDLYGDAMVVPIGWASTLWMETNRNIEFYRVLLQKPEFFPRGTHKH